MTNEQEINTQEEYEAPSMTKLGSINEVTQANSIGSVTDVPQGSPGPNVFS